MLLTAAAHSLRLDIYHAYCWRSICILDAKAGSDGIFYRTFTSSGIDYNNREESLIKRLNGI